MLELQDQMKYGKTADIRGMARFKYAIGRRNSFEECWALTQYWRGEYIGLFEPIRQKLKRLWKCSNLRKLKPKQNIYWVIFAQL